jgi:hypothetical protein
MWSVAAGGTPAAGRTARARVGDVVFALPWAKSTQGICRSASKAVGMPNCRWMYADLPPSQVCWSRLSSRRRGPGDELGCGLQDAAAPGELGEGLAEHHPEQPDAAVCDGRDAVPLVLGRRQPVPGLGDYRPLEDTARRRVHKTLRDTPVPVSRPSSRASNVNLGRGREGPECSTAVCTPSESSASWGSTCRPSTTCCWSVTPSEPRKRRAGPVRPGRGRARP